MPEFQEQLAAVAAIRAKCREGVEATYRTRLAMLQARRHQARVDQRHVIADGERHDEAGRRRGTIDRLNKQLAELRSTAASLDARLAALVQARQLLDHLRARERALREEAAASRQALAELRAVQPPPDAAIEQAEAALAQLAAAHDEMGAAVGRQNAQVERLAADEASTREARRAADRELDALREALQREHERLADATRPAFGDPEAAAERVRSLSAALDAGQAAQPGCEDRLREAIDGLYGRDPHPRGPLQQLGDSTPFLLLPVRLETIFTAGQSSRSAELWVRIYPDEIAVNRFEDALSDAEVAAGELYWVARAWAQWLRAERADRLRDCWRHLVELLGGHRAGWVARRTKPAGYDAATATRDTDTLPGVLASLDPGLFDRLRAAASSPAGRQALDEAVSGNDGDALFRVAAEQQWLDRIDAVVRPALGAFPLHEVTKTDGWTRPPRTAVMPDRFVLLLWATESGAPREVVGLPVPDTLLLGPDPLDADAAFPTADNRVVFGQGFDWMANFDKAVAVGMGFRVALSETEARAGFARVAVLGVRLSADAAAGASELARLIDQHQFGPTGFALAPQGTPTNNAEGGASGFSDKSSRDDSRFTPPDEAPRFDPLSSDPVRRDTDGRLLADALGIPYATLQSVPHADTTDILEARAMSTALFPSTLGYWLRQWTSPVVPPHTAAHTRQFFTRHVTGRGPLPAVVVGNQPYGVLVTSDASRWSYPAPSDGVLVPLGDRNHRAFLSALHGLLGRLESLWDQRVPALPHVGRPGSDPRDVLMQILGLHPTSVEFFQRIGFSHEYLRNLLNFTGKGRHVQELNDHVTLLPDRARTFLHALGITRDAPTLAATKSLNVLWQHYTNALDAAHLVDGRPPSEVEPLQANYIAWLATATATADIVNEQFPGTRPSALLYLLLRNAVLLQLHSGSYQWLKERTIFDVQLEHAVTQSTLVGMRVGRPVVSKAELMATPIERAEPTHPVPSMSVADWIWTGPPPAEAEAAYLREQKAALATLTNTPTARLERCLVEHLDCCNYRLDAWRTGLVAERLEQQRRGVPERTQGIYLGAFGWVEQLRPGLKVPVAPDALPASLRPDDAAPILEEDSVPGPAVATGARQGGFVHTPSLNHAAAAALLRSAYLSHASPEQADVFSVNLSSERVRRGQFVLEGVRNGQPLEALLGYQFERGLHDRTSQSVARGDVPVIELNRFIQPFRQAFPFESQELPQAGAGSATTTVPPYSVVNGLKLAEASLSAGNGFGLAAVLPAGVPNAAQGTAILAEQEALRNTLDAVKDLLMAENAYQLVRGNYDRVGAVSLAQRDAHVPPALEVVNTPRGTQFTFTNRVTLHFPSLDPLAAASNPWPAVPMTPRARAEAGLNAWLGGVLGLLPQQVACTARRVAREGESPAPAPQPLEITLVDLGLQPVDVVWLAAGPGPDRGGASDLEAQIAWYYRQTTLTADDLLVTVDLAAATGTRTPLGHVLALARHLHSLLAQSRALHAGDLLPVPGSQASAVPIPGDNIQGYDVSELRARVQQAATDLGALVDGVLATAPVEVRIVADLSAPTVETVIVGTFGDACDGLDAAGVSYADSSRVRVVVAPSEVGEVHAALRVAALYGVADAWPPEANVVAEAVRRSVLARAHRVVRQLRSPSNDAGALQRAASLLAAATAETSAGAQVARVLDAGRAVIGGGFTWLPTFRVHNASDLVAAAADRIQLLSHPVALDPTTTPADVVDDWLLGAARVRDALHRWDTVRTLSEALGGAVLDLTPVQVPYRAKDHWLAVEFPAAEDGDPATPFAVTRDTLSIVAHGTSAFQAGAQSGLLLDDWTEEIPTDHETTGVAFRFNRPNAVPPQTLLLAVTPVETGAWQWDHLVGTLTDTMRRMKHRAVEPALLETLGQAWNAFAPALVSEFSTEQRADVSLDLLMMTEARLLRDLELVRATRTP